MRSLPVANVPLFKVIGIETKNVCNRTCWFCKWGQLREKEPRIEMSWELIEKLLKDLSDLNFEGRLSWFGYNEPLSDPRIYEIIAKSRKVLPKALLHIATNGDLLSQKNYDRLAEAGLDKCAVSVYDQKTLDKAKGIKGNKLYLMNHMDSGFMENLTNRGGQLAGDFKSAHARKRYQENCQRPMTTMWIRSNGDACLCCEDMYGDVVVGNVKSDTLKDIWYGVELSKYRQILACKGRDEIKICDSCNYSGAPQSIDWPERSDW